MTKLDITKFSKYELNFKLLEKGSSGWSIFIFSMFLVFMFKNVSQLIKSHFSQNCSYKHIYTYKHDFILEQLVLSATEQIKSQNMASPSIIQNRVKLKNTNFCYINFLFFPCIQHKSLTVKLCMYMVCCQDNTLPRK